MNEINKIPPQAVELENAVLGALINEESSYKKIESILTSEEFFYKNENKTVFKAIKELKSRNKNVDILTVVEKIKSTGELDNIGGVMYLTGLSNSVAMSFHIAGHAEIIKQKYIQRKLIEVSYELIEQSYSDEFDFEFIDDHEKKLKELVNLTGSYNEIRPISEYLSELSVEITQRINKYNERGIAGINTGSGALNKFTAGGWHDSDLIIVAARPGMGKTAIALKFARSAAQDKNNVAIFSLEMSGRRLTERMCYSYSNLDIDKFKEGNISDKDLDEFYKANDILHDLPISISDKAYDTISNIKRKCKRLKNENKLDLIVIDYLQLANLEGKDNRNREQEVSESSRALKGLAKELEVPIILLSQLNRASVQSSDKRPQLHHLRESGQLEQDADIVIGLHRETVINPDALDEDGKSLDGIIELIILKNREGSLGTVKLNHNETLTQFSDYSPEYDSSIESVNYYENDNPF